MTACPRLLVRVQILLAVAFAVAGIMSSPAAAHSERPAESPPRPGSVPDVSRIRHQHPVLDVCKTKVSGRAECRFQDIQAAVNEAPNGALIRIWPGLYQEMPSRRAKDLPANNPDGTYSYDLQRRHPNAINLIAVLGKKNITLLGMGRKPTDVVIDVGFAKHVGVRADRADGFIIKNVSVWHAVEHGVYILDQSGFLIDQVKSGFSGLYSFLTFATDHGLYRNCEALGAGDAGLYPGGTAETPGRFSTEIDHCVTHHNVLGFSGTQGDHVWIHDSVFYDNAAGLVSDSETDHPNYPQNDLVLERNRFFDNNFDAYATDSDIAAEQPGAGVGGGGVVVPVGIGVLLASGNDNIVQRNHVWGHDRYGIALWSGQGMVVGPTSDPAAMPFVSSGNRFIGNHMYPPRGVSGRPNHIDFGWDGAGQNNCWQDNVRSRDGSPATTDALLLPPCHLLPEFITAPPPVWVPNPLSFLEQLGLVVVNGRPLCATFFWQQCYFGPAADAEHARNTKEGQRTEWPPPPTCGPSTCGAVLERRYG